MKWTSSSASNYVLSVRSRARRGFADVRTRTEREPDLLKHGPAYVLYALMDAVVDRYFPVIDALENEIEEIEARIFREQTTRAQIESLYELRRKIMVLKHAAGPLLEATGKLQAGRVPPVCAGLVDYFRDVYDHLKRLNQSHRQPARHGHHGHRRQPVPHHAAGKRSHQATGRLRRAGGRADDDCRCVRDELPADAGAAVGVRLSGRNAVMVAIDGYLFYRFRKAKWL